MTGGSGNIAHQNRQKSSQNIFMWHTSLLYEMYEEEAGYYAQMVMEVTKRLALGNWLVWCVSDVEENSLAVKMKGFEMGYLNMLKGAFRHNMQAKIPLQMSQHAPFDPVT